MFRMVGGTFGVAAIGALFQSLARTRIDERLSGLHVPGSVRSGLVDNLGAGAGTKLVRQMDPHTAKQVAAAMKDAFVHALTGGLTLSCSVAAAGAVLAFVLVEPKRALKRHLEPARQPEAAAEAIGV